MCATSQESHNKTTQFSNNVNISNGKEHASDLTDTCGILQEEKQQTVQQRAKHIRCLHAWALPFHAEARRPQVKLKGWGLGAAPTIVQGAEAKTCDEARAPERTGPIGLAENGRGNEWAGWHGHNTASMCFAQRQCYVICDGTAMAWHLRCNGTATTCQRICNDRSMVRQ